MHIVMSFYVKTSKEHLPTAVAAAAVLGLAFSATALGVSSAETVAVNAPAKQAEKAGPDKSAAPARGTALPVHDAYVSAGWGHSSGPHAGREHAGVDFAADMNEPVYAARAGKVKVAGANGGYGNMIRIKHADGTSTMYGHLNKIGVKAGQSVKAGDRIGAVGSTGHSTGPHLHFEVRSAKDVAIHPVNWLGLESAELRKRLKESSR